MRPGGKFPQRIVRGMTILTLEQDPRRRSGFVDRQNDDGAGVMNHVATGANTAWFLHFVGRHPKHGATIHGARREVSELSGEASWWIWMA